MYIAQLAKLSNVLAIIGSVVSVLALVGMSAAWTAQYLLQRQYPEFRLGVSAGTTMFGHLAALSVPFVCIAGWIFSTLYLA